MKVKHSVAAILTNLAVEHDLLEQRSIEQEEFGAANRMHEVAQGIRAAREAYLATFKPKPVEPKTVVDYFLGLSLTDYLREAPLGSTIHQRHDGSVYATRVENDLNGGARWKSAGSGYLWSVASFEDYEDEQFTRVVVA